MFRLVVLLMTQLKLNQKNLDSFSFYMSHYLYKKGVTHLVYLSHARPYFDQSLTQDKIRGEFSMTKIQKLYTLEREAVNLTAQDLKTYRLKKVLSIINQFGEFIGE